MWKSNTPLQATEKPSALVEKVVFYGPEDIFCTSYVKPDGVTEIGDGAFRYCGALKTIKVLKGMDVSNYGLDEDVQIIYY